MKKKMKLCCQALAGHRKTFLIMRVSLFLILISAFQVLAGVSYSQSARLSLNMKNSTVREVLATIEDRSDFYFLYNNQLIDVERKVNVDVKDEKIDAILSVLFNDGSVNVLIRDRHIILTPVNNVSVIQQHKSVSGKVTDSSGGPLPGVTVVVKGTQAGTVTSGDGSFSLSNIPENATLLISFVGMKTQEVEVDGRNEIAIILKEETIGIDEVVAIGYGSQSKKEITGAVGAVRLEDFNKGNINNPVQLLQGKIAGLSIVAPQANPNGTFEIRMRGLSTLGANTQPLVIVDGVVGASLNNVDPNDIASVDVLKDGAAAAIYGTRGSSGVILITTKNGTKGKPRVDFNNYVTAENVDRSHPVMNLQEYLDNGGTDLGSNTNWMEEITRTAVSHIHNLSLSGGTDQTTYMASLNYRNVDGVLLNSGFDQLNGRLNLTQKAFNNRLNLTLNMAATSKEAKLGFDEAFRFAIVMPPSAPIHSADSYYKKYGGYFQSEVHELYNPVGVVKQNINNQKLSRIMYNLQADYKIVDNLTATVRYSRNTENSTNSTYISKYSYYGSGTDRNGLATQSNWNAKNDLFEATGSYVGSFKNLNIAAVAGYSYQNFTTENLSVQGGNFLTDAFTYNNFAASKDFADGKAIGSSSKENNKLIAFLGRLNLNYDNTYFLSASLRREGSTRFGEGNKWGNFYGISAGVDVCRLFTIPKVDQLKIRSSYGVTGALPAQSYLSQQLFGPGSSATYFLYNGVYTPVYSPQSNPNPDLKWETKSEIDFGIDFSLFNSRLNGTFDYYSRKTSDALITLEVPVPPNLFPTSVLNAGELRNNGIELSLDFQAVRGKKFRWTPEITFASYNTKIISLSMGDLQYGIREVGGLPAPLTGNAVRVQEGHKIGQMIGWVYEGVDAQGNYILKDVNGDTQIDAKDVTVIGNGLPKGELGLTNKFSFGKFDFSFFLRGVYGHDLLNLNRTMFEQISRISSYNLLNTKYFDPKYKGPAAYNSHYLEDASFIKLDNFTLGYNFKFPVYDSVTNARVYFSGQNLFYITKYTGIDPEPRYSYQNNVLAPGIEPRESWITTRTFTFGVNLSF